MSDLNLLPDLPEQTQPSFEPALKNTALDALPDLETTAQKTYSQVRRTSPDEAAKILTIAKKTGEPYSFVAANLPDAEVSTNEPTTQFWRDLDRQYPGTSKWLQTPENMAVAHDDFDNLVWYERWWKEVRAGHEKNSLENKLADLRGKQLKELSKTGKLNQNYDWEINAIKNDLTRMEQEAPKGFHPLYHTSAQSVNWGRGAMEAAKFGLPAAGTGALTALGLGQLGPQVAIPEELLTVPGAAIAFGKVGAAAGAGKFAYTLERNLAFDQYLGLKDKAGNPIDPKKAAEAAETVGLINGALETVGDIVLFKGVAQPIGKAGLMALSKIPGATKVLSVIQKNPQVFAKMTMRQAITEAVKMVALTQVSEGSTEYLQEVVSGAGQNRAITLSGQDIQKTPTLQILSDATQVIGPTMQGVLLPGLLGGGSHIYTANKQMAIAEQNKAFYTALGETSKNSKLRQRLPEAHQSLIAELTKDGPVDGIWVRPAALEKYFSEKGLDAAAAMQELGLDSKLWQEATETGDLKIPLATWMKVVDSEHYTGLADDVRFNQSDLSVNEAKELQAESKKMEAETERLMQEAVSQADQMAKQIEQEAANNPQVKADYDKVFGLVKTELEGVGMETAQAEQNAKVWASRTITEARKRNVTVDSLLAAKPQVQGTEQSTAGPEALTQEQAKLLSGTKVLDVEGNPLRVFHGTQPRANVRAFEVSDFDTDYSEMGTHFGTSKQAERFSTDPEYYGRVYSVYLNIKNPLRLKDVGNFSPESVWKQLRRKKIVKGEYNGESVKEIQDIIKAKGYDGIVYLNRAEGRDNSIWNKYEDNYIYSLNTSDEELKSLDPALQDSYIVFSPDQIVNAIGVKDPSLLMQSYFELEQPKKAAVDKYLKNSPDGKRIKENIERLKDTPWESTAVEALLIRAAIDDLVAGKEPKFESYLTAPSVKKAHDMILKDGEEGVWKYIRQTEDGFIGHPEKPGNAINASYVNCQPSKLCAEYCYAATGRNFANNMVKMELVNWAIENDPVRAAKYAAEQYKITPEFEAKKALRIFDKGDGSPKWIAFIKEMNKQGVRLQIFSRRPEFLKLVPEENVAMLSIDASNYELADKNPDFAIALAYAGKEDNAFLEKNKDRFEKHGGVVLPIKIGREILSQEERDTLPEWAKKYTCPVDNGVASLKDGWKCTKCDKNGGLGCFFGKTTSKIMEELAKPLPNFTDIDERVELLKKLLEGASDGTRQELLGRLDNIISQVRQGIDPETAEGPGAEDGQAPAGDKSPEILMQEALEKDPNLLPAPMPTFYSKLQNTINQKMSGPMPAEQLRAMIAGSGIKQEELEWYDFDNFLNENPKPTKEQVMEHLRGNELKIQEVSKGTEMVHGWAVQGPGGGIIETKPYLIKEEAEDALKDYVKGYVSKGGKKEKDFKVVPLSVSKEGTATKFSQFTLPGGENYREVLFTLPEQVEKGSAVTPEMLKRYDALAEKINRTDEEQEEFRKLLKMRNEDFEKGKGEKKSFHSSHWDEPNVLAHVRLNDRIVDGKRVLFVEEVQSDWHQAGREKGYNIPSEVDREAEEYKTLNSKQDRTKADDNRLEELTDKLLEKYNVEDDSELTKAIDNKLKEQREGVPNAPLKKTWHEFVMKRVIRMAAEEGYDKVAWTTGEQQAERYDLSKQIGSIDYKTNSNNLIAFDKQGNSVIEEQVPPEKIADYIGKDAAQKLLSSPLVETGFGNKKHHIEGGDLKLGGEGMKGFYDQMLPAFVNKFTKKWGGKVEESSIDSSKGRDLSDSEMSELNRLANIRNRTEEQTRRYFELGKLNDGTAEAKLKVHSLTITPAMRESVMQGLPLFQSGPNELLPINVLGKKVLVYKNPTSADMDEMRKDYAEWFRGEFGMYPHNKQDREESLRALEDGQGNSYVWSSHNGQHQDVAEALKRIGVKVDVKSGFYLEQEARGFYDQAQNIIGLLKNKDASTFMHESAHFWLKSQFDFVKSGQADEAYLKDWKVMAEWLGVKDDQKTLTKDQQEKFARGWEAYLMEGKAPSETLKDAFNSFRAWLVSIYKTIRNLKVDLTPEVRNVFDRMLASESEIATARAEIGTDQPLELADVPETLVKDIDRLRKKANEEAMTTLTKHLMKELEEKYVREKESYRAKLKREEAERLRKEPAFAAMEFLRSSNKFIGKDPKEVSQKYLNGGLTEVGMANYDSIAIGLGYADGHEMARLITNAPLFIDILEERVEMGMTAKYADLADLPDFKEQALAAIHNEYSIELMALEKEALRAQVFKRTDQDYIKEATRNLVQLKAEAAQKPLKDFNARIIEEARIVKQKAKDILGSKPYREANQYRIYITAEKNAAVALGRALAKKDYAAAIVAKTQQMLNHALAMESIRIRQQGEKVADFLWESGKRTETLPASGKLAISAEANEQVNRLLMRYGFADLIPMPAQTKSLAEYVADLQSHGDDVVVAPWLMDGSVPASNWKDLSIEQLLDLRDAVKSIKQAGKRENTLSTGELLADVASDFVNTISTNLKENPTPYDPAASNVFATGLKNFVNAHRNLSYITKELDGFTFGKITKFVMGRLRKARAMESSLGTEANQKLEAIWDKHYPAQGGNPLNKWKARSEMSTKRIFFNQPLIDAVFPKGVTKENLLMMALNQGTELNRQRLLESYAYQARNPITGELEWTYRLGQEHIDMMLAKLDKNDWMFVQDVLDMVNSYWPKIAELERERTGIEPRKREAIAIETPHGTFSGGYFHIEYDPRYSNRADQQSLEDSMKGLIEGSHITPSTRRGHTKETVTHVWGRPLMLQFSVIDRHVHSVIHDLSFIEAIRDLDRVFTNEQVSNAIKARMGDGAYKQIRPALAYIGYENRPQANPVERIFSSVRARASAFYLMFRLTSVLSQTAGVGVAMGAVGAKNYVAHLNTWSPEKWNFVMEKSRIMRERVGNRDRDVRDAMKSMMEKGKLNNLTKFGFFMQGYMDVAIAMPQWMAAYDNELDRQNKAGEKMDMDAAITVADETVQTTQGSGDAIDLSAMQRGSEFMKLLTMFYTPFAPIANKQIEMFERLRQNGISDLPAAMSFMAYWIVLPGVVAGLMSGDIPDGEDDDESWYAWTIRQSLAQFFGGWVFVRDAANYATKGGRLGYKLSPVEGTIEKTLKPITDVVKMTRGEDVEPGTLAKDTAEAAMLIAKMPGRQISITAGYIVDLLTGEADQFEAKRLIYPEKKN